MIYLLNMPNTPTKETIHAWIQLHRANRLLLEKVETALKAEELPPLDWYDVLLELKNEKTKGLRQYEIGEKVLLNKHNLSRLIDRLESHQLLSRHVCTEDGRGNQIKITDKGEKMLQRMWPVYRQAIQESFGNLLDKSELVTLSSILKNVLHSSQDD